MDEIKPAAELDARIPVLVVGDAPTQPTGLGRIARDITELLRRDAAAGLLLIRVAQLGLNYDGRRCNWHVYPIRDGENWGQEDIGPAWEDWRGLGYKGPGVIFSVWDPGRCPALVMGLGGVRVSRGDEPDKPMHWSYFSRWTEEGYTWPQLWGYFAVDAEDKSGGLGGPVPEGLAQYQRLLAYGIYGAGVLEKTTGKPVPWLPHGIDLDVFSPRDVLPESMPEEWREARTSEGKRPVTIGVVATNTPRKDFGLVFGALDGIDCRLWIHTDKLVTNAWSIVELARQYGRNSPDRLVVTQELDDEGIAQWYSACDATLAPGLGEGFGYPIVESLACGTPVVHVNYAGGSQLIPAAAWRMQVAGHRLEGPYALLRPVVNPLEVRECLRAAVRWKRKEPGTVAAYCRGAVVHLDWKNLWPWWRQWFEDGLGRLRE